MAPGLTVDKDVVSGVLAGDLQRLSDPVAVVAVARASHHIAGLPFGPDDAQRLLVAVEHLNTLIEAAHEADRRAPDLLPVVHPASALVRVEAEAPARPAGPGRGPAAWVVVVVVFAVGVLVGMGGSRLTGSPEPAAGPTPARAATPECLAPDEPRPSGKAGMGPVPPGWWANDASMGLTPMPEGFVAAVPEGATLPQQLIVIRSGVTLTAGRHYRFDFTAASDRPVDILLRIQDKTPPLYRPSLVESVPVDRAPCRRSYRFTAVMTSATTGEVTFQLGGLGSFAVTVDNAVLVETEG
jgi:hypothetical protein